MTAATTPRLPRGPLSAERASDLHALAHHARPRTRLDGVGRDGPRVPGSLRGHAVASTGHAHPEVVRGDRASRRDAPLLLECRRARRPHARRGRDHAPCSRPAARRSSSSTPARKRTRTRCVSRAASRGARTSSLSTGGFHGRTADAISAAGLAKYRELAKPNVPGPPVRALRGPRGGRTRAIDDTRRRGPPRADPEPGGSRRRRRRSIFSGLRRLCDERGAKLDLRRGPDGIRTYRNVSSGRAVTESSRTSSRSPKGIASGVPDGRRARLGRDRRLR